MAAELPPPSVPRPLPNPKSVPRPVEDGDGDDEPPDESVLSARRSRIEREYKVGGLQCLLWNVRWVFRPPLQNVSISLY